MAKKSRKQSVVKRILAKRERRRKKRARTLKTRIQARMARVLSQLDRQALEKIMTGTFVLLEEPELQGVAFPVDDLRRHTPPVRQPDLAELPHTDGGTLRFHRQPGRSYDRPSQRQRV